MARRAYLRDVDFAPPFASSVRMANIDEVTEGEIRTPHCLLATPRR